MLKDKIKLLKMQMNKNEVNQDYYTGYMSALSTVEGIIAEMENEKNDRQQGMGFNQTIH